MKATYKSIIALLLLVMPIAVCAQNSGLAAQKAAIKNNKNRTNTANSGTVNGHKWVDLGLSVNWADMNVLAESVDDAGGYFSWGETRLKTTCTPENTPNMNKYNMSSISGDEQYDAARARMGGKWRMPTADEWQELIDNCEWDLDIVNDKLCYKATGPNGQSIYLPAAGELFKEGLIYEEEKGHYWTATPDETDGGYYAELDADNGLSVSLSYRYDGMPIRAVINKEQCK